MRSRSAHSPARTPRDRRANTDVETEQLGALELEPVERLTFSWGWTDEPDSLPPGSTTVEIELLPDGDGTLIRLTHRDLPEAAAPLHEMGWLHYLARLEVVATGGDPGADPGLRGRVP
jgi:uncharacterized protein YndB with AHSA1/START domain